VARTRSLSEFQTSFPDETSCAAFLFQRRWPQGFACPVCEGARAVLLKSRARRRRTATGMRADRSRPREKVEPSPVSDSTRRP
jgi:Transposase zinc-ribbon domain